MALPRLLEGYQIIRTSASSRTTAYIKAEKKGAQMIHPDNPYRIFIDPDSIRRAEQRDNALNRDDVRETREDSEDWLVRLIERKLRGEA